MVCRFRNANPHWLPQIRKSKGGNKRGQGSSSKTGRPPKVKKAKVLTSSQFSNVPPQVEEEEIETYEIQYIPPNQGNTQPMTITVRQPASSSAHLPLSLANTVVQHATANPSQNNTVVLHGTNTSAQNNTVVHHTAVPTTHQQQYTVVESSNTIHPTHLTQPSNTQHISVSYTAEGEEQVYTYYSV